MLFGSTAAMVPTVSSMSYFVAPPLVQNLHRTLSKATANLIKEGLQCFKVISGHKVDKEAEVEPKRRPSGDTAFVLTCSKEKGTQISVDGFDFYYYNTKEFSDHIFPISTVKMSVYGDGEITIKLFWKNFGFFENRVTIRGNRDIETLPWINKEGEEVPFASFLLKDRSDSFCQSVKVEILNFSGLGANYGKRGTMTCQLKDDQKSLTWASFDFVTGK
ncbi:hypothetical protein WEN_01850 [Mycoplasma wenyonii str. Massachusetts]|uniref:Uncharacterized protein n=2 Tax=Mycoplasma wenyonii TaxID=65123 RepID=I6Z6F0_MYCWM|nr:hypothetical protein WEN_01850 [Mycoplasma wenyonii str. Massachusetts]